MGSGWSLSTAPGEVNQLSNHFTQFKCSLPTLLASWKRAVRQSDLARICCCSASAKALLEAQSSGRMPKVAAVEGLLAERQAQAQHFADGQYTEFMAKQATGRAELERRLAALETSRRQIGKLTQTAPLARQSADNYRALVKDNYVSRQDYLEKEQARIQQEEELAAEKSRARELEAAVEQQRRDLAAQVAQIVQIAQFRREQLDALNQAHQQLAVIRLQKGLES